MSTSVSKQVKAARNSFPALKAVRAGVLQRKCACGQHTVAGGECQACDKKRLQRSAVNQAEPAEAPPVVHDVLRSSGQPLDAQTRAFMEPRFLQDFSQVRVHSLSTKAAQPTPMISTPGDMYEQEADRMASTVIGAPESRAEISGGSLRVSKAEQNLAPSYSERPSNKSSMPETPHRLSFDHVRVHTDARAAESAQAVGALAYTVGNNIVFGAGQYAPHTTGGRKLLAHELTHVAQQTRTSASGVTSSPALVQRKVILKGAEMPAKDRAAFLKAHTWTSAAKAKAVMEDMAAADDKFDFADENELEREIVKRLSTVEHMKESQETEEKIPGDKRSAFGYPFTGQSALYGPRVNYAAQDYWEPPVPDDYALRKDKAKNKDLLDRPRSQKCLVYGDQCKPYGWKLTTKGQADPYQAISKLFTPQPPHKRTLIHCDHLVSLVNFLSLADAVGQAEFNKRIKAFGADKIFLKWNAFSDLHVSTLETSRVGERSKTPGGKLIPKKGLGSTQRIKPSSEEDFVIGDHVVFFNHLAYDLLNKKIGNAWRLENAVLIRKDEKGRDVFLGHGSGQKTSQQMRVKLKTEYNDVARIALKIVARTKTKDKKAQTAALSELSEKFPNVHKVGDEWRVQGVPGLLDNCPRPIGIELREIKPDEVLGPKSPCNPEMMNEVERPIESAK